MSAKFAVGDRAYFTRLSQWGIISRLMDDKGDDFPQMYLLTVAVPRNDYLVDDDDLEADG